MIYRRDTPTAQLFPAYSSATFITHFRSHLAMFKILLASSFPCAVLPFTDARTTPVGSFFVDFNENPRPGVTGTGERGWVAEKVAGGYSKVSGILRSPNSLARVSRKIKGLMNALPSDGTSPSSAIIIKLHGRGRSAR